MGSGRICIRKSPSADSRTAEGPLTVETLRTSTDMHMHDVRNALRFICEELVHRGDFHDRTKMERMDDFHAALTSGNVKDSEWYQYHITEERHHLKSHVPDDVNLIDVVEHVCDCVMAGMARSGQVYDIDLPPETLSLALKNTVELLKSVTYIDPEEKTAGDIMNNTIDV